MKMERENVFEGRFVDVQIRSTSDQKIEVVVSCNSVAVLVYNRRLRKAVLVQQSRLAMVSANNRKGIITEVIAGRMNKYNLTLKGLIALEIKEEVGVDVPENDIIVINGLQSLAMSPGMATERCYLALAEIPASSFPKEGSVFGVQEEGESTRPVIYSFEELDALVYEDMKTLALVQFFLRGIEREERSRVR
ncbi:MAG: hypothetical protein Q8R29_02115 [bacterium]|nr:hypothetical protein [bacterium]